MINYRAILDSFLSTIYGISDPQYQQRVWVQGAGPECDDLEETYCCFFDVGDLILLDYKKYDISEEQYILLMTLRGLLDYFGEEFYVSSSYPVATTISLPEWKIIQDVAADIIQSFKYPYKFN